MGGTCPAVKEPVETSPELPARRPVALLPERIRSVRHPRWWQELLFVAICYELYSLVRNAVPEHERPAFSRATDLINLEHRMHIGLERSVNMFVARHDAIAYVCNYYYATLHFIVTIGVMVWLYHRHPLRYRSLRTVLIVTNVVALLGFWLYALAPPRMLPQRGFVDTVVTFHTWGSWGSSGVESASNQFAAMPSLHIGWSLWCAIVVFSLARRWWVRTLAVLYPLCTLFVIVGTANHYLLDAVGGAVVVGVGFAVERLLSGRKPFGALPVAAPPNARARVPAPRQPDQVKNTRS